MKICGDILVGKPGLREQKILFKNGTEFSFATADSPEEKIDFYIWFELDGDNVTIENSKDLYINGKLFLKDPYAKKSSMQDICKMLREISKIVTKGAIKKN